MLRKVEFGNFRLGAARLELVPYARVAERRSAHRHRTVAAEIDIVRLPGPAIADEFRILDQDRAAGGQNSFLRAVAGDATDGEIDIGLVADARTIAVVAPRQHGAADLEVLEGDSGRGEQQAGLAFGQGEAGTVEMRRPRDPANGHARPVDPSDSR